MTTDITELAQRMKAAAEKATPGEWWADEVKSEGCYGSGDDCVEGFTSYAIYGSDGQTLFDSLNSDAACICEEYDGEGHVVWDETAQRNAEFIALANPANIRALVEALEKAQAKNALVAGGIEATAKLHERIAELEEAEQKLCAANVTLDARAELAERRLAEMESRTVTIEPFRSFVTDADLAALHRFAECCDDPESGGHDLEQEQVRRLEAIGALQRSGRISYITSFGDVLISITAGIKVEAE
ncbi:ead/Ea22-like family protein [Enterococcus faecalis]|uniref:ead/Ea22-like family protein n=1 Tax=Enterococcus faecalis TaxID=1351 RepID=UPI00115F3CA2|nr:ead/Ea22-like family protein [Enterococcus faecalis]MDU3694062.1 ead/Ea22-like family protein [Klebsiella michiganensis]MDU3715324.1 ead/Ea22-like family protein [Klebsiella michiganensis]